MENKCKGCGRSIDPRFTFCNDCIRKFPKDYLSKGYFDEKDNIYPNLIDKDAQRLVNIFGRDRNALTSTQLRRFFNLAQSAKTRILLTKNFDRVYGDILMIKSIAGEAQGSRKVPDSFYIFIEKNIDLSNNERNFMSGFFRHFEAILHWFKYYFPRR